MPPHAASLRWQQAANIPACDTRPQPEAEASTRVVQAKVTGGVGLDSNQRANDMDERANGHSKP